MKIWQMLRTVQSNWWAYGISSNWALYFSVYGKVQKSGLIEIIPLIYTLIIRASILFFSILNPLKSAQSRAAALAESNNILCLLMWQVQFGSVAQCCPTLYDPMDCSTPGFPVLHQLPELAQTHVQWVCDAIQPSYPLMWASDVHKMYNN